MDEDREPRCGQGVGARGWSLMEISNFLTDGLMAQSLRAINDLGQVVAEWRRGGPAWNSDLSIEVF